MILSKLLTYKLFESNKPSILLDEDDIKEYFIDLIDEGYEIDKISVMYGDRNGESWSKSNFPKVGYIPYYELKLKVNREKGGMHYMKSPKDIKIKINIYNILLKMSIIILSYDFHKILKYQVGKYLIQLLSLLNIV